MSSVCYALYVLSSLCSSLFQQSQTYLLSEGRSWWYIGIKACHLHVVLWRTVVDVLKKATHNVGPWTSFWISTKPGSSTIVPFTTWHKGQITFFFLGFTVECLRAIPANTQACESSPLEHCNTVMDHSLYRTVGRNKAAQGAVFTSYIKPKSILHPFSSVSSFHG